MFRDLLYDFINWVSSLIITMVVVMALLFIAGETIDYIHSHHEIPYCPPDPSECD